VRQPLIFATAGNPLIEVLEAKAENVASSVCTKPPFEADPTHRKLFMGATQFFHVPRREKPTSDLPTPLKMVPACPSGRNDMLGNLTE
ncbi:hypothetical protein AVEN_105535-1, partial [Araneus ventricosus]